MKKSLLKWLEDAWYQEMYISSWLMPISMLYVDAVKLRRFLYRIGILKKTKLSVPVVIVGNITVGGTGKTPLVIYLVELLKQQGYHPGVISRGYAGSANKLPQTVQADSDSLLVGDEAVVLAKRCLCPVTVCQDRVAAAQTLLANHPNCDVIISDDGLQHYALQRDIEIVVIDGARRFGNGYCLPVGPLREPPERIKQVDLIVVNGGTDLQADEFAMNCQGHLLVNLQSGVGKQLAEFKAQQCHAVAAIGNPSRFFGLLENAGVDCIALAYPDHYQFKAADVNFNDDKPVLMTEKDAVKCLSLATAKHWYLPISAELPPAFTQQFLSLLKEKSHG